MRNIEVQKVGVAGIDVAEAEILMGKLKALRKARC